MHDDTVLPVRNQCIIPNRSYTRLHFVQEKTRNSLFYLKWLELIACLLCLSFTFITIYATDITKLNKSAIVISNSVSVCLIFTEISFPYFKKSVPLILQIIDVGFNSVMYGLLMVLIYQIKNHHDLVNTLKILHGATSVLFLVDFLCKIIISQHFYETTKAQSVVDVGVSTNLPSPSNPRKPARSALTTTPITYGGTFPVSKNLPPFMPNTINIMDETAVKSHKPSFDFGPSSVERLMSKTKTVQTYLAQEQKSTNTLPPFYLEEERKRKTQWSSNKRRRGSRSTPVTYSGTFACDKELVPIAPSPINIKHNFPPRELGWVLNQISEEKLSVKTSSSGNCSLTNTFPHLPGCVMDEQL